MSWGGFSFIQEPLKFLRFSALRCRFFGYHGLVSVARDLGRSEGSQTPLRPFATISRYP